MDENPTIVDFPYLERVLLLLLALCGLLYMTGLVSGTIRWELLQQIRSEGGVSIRDARLSDSFYLLVPTLQYWVVLAIAVVWLIWLYRSYRALQGVGVGATDYSPGFAVGCWFIPWLNMFRPFQIVRELWLRSRSMNDDHYIDTKNAPAMLLLWWISLIWSFVVSRQGTANWIRESFGDMTVLESQTVAWLLRSVVLLIATILAIRIVYQIAGFQVDWNSRARTTSSEPFAA